MAKTATMINHNSISIKNYFKDLKKIESKTGDEQIELIRQAKLGNEKALETVINSNLRFVVSVAKDFQHYGLPLEDLISEGNIGLMKAVDKFDSTKGFRFISYAVWWVRQSIMQSVYENGNSIRIPINKINIINKVTKHLDKLYNELDREPTIEEISQSAELTQAEVGAVIRENFISLSLDEKIFDDSEQSKGSQLPSDSFSDFENMMEEKTLREQIKNVVDTLSKKEKEVIKMYFGLDGYHEMSLKEIGVELDLTNERVRQIKEFGLKKLRTYSKSEPLREFRKI
jgi:RNA polymerase primary sigma factor